MSEYGQNAYPYPPVAPQPKRSRTLAIALGIGALAVVVLVLALLLGGGGPSNKPEATATTAAPTSMSIAEQDAAFYRWVNRHPWSQNGNTEEDWTSLASSMCGAMDRGAQYSDVATILIEDLDDFSTSDAHDFVAQAISIYCPEYSGRVGR